MIGKFATSTALKTTTALAGALGIAPLLAAMPAPAFAQATGSEQIPGSPDGAENGANIDANAVKFVDVSGDGNSTLGYKQTAVNGKVQREAWVFRSTGATMLANPTGYATSMPEKISADGSVVAGRSMPTAYTDLTGMVAVKWVNGTPTILANPDGSANYKAVAVSGNGKVVGGSTSPGGSLVLWADGAAPELLGVGKVYTMTGLSHDGSAFSVFTDEGRIVTDQSGQWNVVNHAMRWTRAGGFRSLGTIAGHTMLGSSYANDISSDGNTIVGYAREGQAITGINVDRNDYWIAAKWTPATGMIALPKLTEQVRSTATAVNADGSVIVGDASVPTTAAGVTFNKASAVRWAGNSVQTVANWLTANGVSNGANEYHGAVGVSADGNVVVGHG